MGSSSLTPFKCLDCKSEFDVKTDQFLKCPSCQSTKVVPNFPLSVGGTTVEEAMSRKLEAISSTVIHTDNELTEEERARQKEFPFKNLTMGGRFIKEARQERRGTKVVLIDPKGKVVAIMSNLDRGFKRRQNHNRRRS